MKGIINLWGLIWAFSFFGPALSWSEEPTLARDEDGRTKDYYDIPLDPQNRLHLFWDVYYERDEVVLEIHAEIPETNWLALGFSDYGESNDADLCVLWVDRRGKVHFQDSWTDEESILHVDRQQDCSLLDVQRQGGTTILVFRRKFNTCDKYDYVIEDGTTHVVWGTGKGPFRRLEGLRITDGQVGFQRTQLMKNKNPPPKLPTDTVAISIVNNKVHVPNVETTYWCSLHKLPSLLTKHHIVQFEAVIQPGNEALVHHMEVFHCEVPPDQELPDYNAPCQAESKPPKLEACKKVLAAWAMGALPLRYPEEAGAPLGGPGFSSYVMLEIHYNNPERKDWIDSSGARIHYTSQLRQFDVGVVELGLEYTPKMAIPPRQNAFTLSGHCIVECTEAGIPPSGIVMFASQLHTHLTGVRVITRHIRGSTELAELNRDNHYSPHFQEIRILKKPKLILPGDALITTCTHKTLDRENITLGGFAISDEMCVNYVHYYPKTNLEVCKSSINTDVLNDYFSFMHDYEKQPTSSKKDVSENYRSIDWNPLRSQLLHDLYETAPVSMQCNQSNGDRFPGYWNNMPLVEVIRPLPPPLDPCLNEPHYAFLEDNSHHL